MQPTRPAGPVQPQKKKSNGCLIAVGILVGLFLLGSIGLGVVGWKVANSESGRKALKVIGGSVSMMQEATTAPGAQELRELGCETAMILDLGKLQGVIDEAEIDSKEPLPEMTSVVCSLGLLARTVPTCAQVASTYLAAVPEPPGSFVVVVQRQASNDPECTAHYDRSGKELPLDLAEMPDLPEVPEPSDEPAP